jgi:hypothetical protein
VLHLVRWIVALLACVSAVVAVTGAVAAYYARLELLDTDRFTERTANIGEDEQVQQGIAALTTKEIEKALEGDNAGSIQAEGTTLTLDLGKIVAIVKETMVESDVALAEDIPAVEADYVLVDSEQVPELQRTVDQLDWAADWLPWLALGLLVIAFVLVPRRWVAALVVGVLGAVLAGVALWSIGEGKTLFVARARDAAFAPVTYDAFTDQLKATYVVMLVIAVLLALVAVGALFMRRKRADA